MQHNYTNHCFLASPVPQNSRCFHTDWSSAAGPTKRWRRYRLGCKNNIKMVVSRSGMWWWCLAWTGRVVNCMCWIASSVHAVICFPNFLSWRQDQRPFAGVCVCACGASLCHCVSSRMSCTNCADRCCADPTDCRMHSDSAGNWTNSVSGACSTHEEMWSSNKTVVIICRGCTFIH